MRGNTRRNAAPRRAGPRRGRARDGPAAAGDRRGGASDRAARPLGTTGRRRRAGLAPSGLGGPTSARARPGRSHPTAASSLGVVVHLSTRLPYHDALWHALALAAACHYAVVLRLAAATG